MAVTVVIADAALLASCPTIQKKLHFSLDISMPKQSTKSRAKVEPGPSGAGMRE